MGKFLQRVILNIVHLCLEKLHNMVTCTLCERLMLFKAALTVGLCL